MRARRVCIKEEFVEICQGDFLKALILDKMIDWIDTLALAKEYIEAENVRLREALKQTISFTQDGWIYKTEAGLKKELMLNISERTIKRAIDELVELGFLEKRTNPERPYERALQYRPNFPFIVRKLEEAGWRGELKIDNLKIQRVNRPGQAPQPSQPNQKASKNAPSPEAKSLAAFAFRQIQSHHRIKFSPAQILNAEKMFDKFLKKGYKAEKIRDAIYWVMSDRIPRDGFCWADQFQSPLKLQRRDKEGILYLDKFINLMEHDPEFGGYFENNGASQVYIPEAKVGVKYKRRIAK